MKYLMIAVAILAVAGCNQEDQDRVARYEQRQERDKVSSNAVSDIAPTKYWRMDGGTWLVVFTDPDTHCEYLIAAGGHSITPRMTANADGSIRHICN